jgi:acetyl-CoA carboxylase carboxyltransferase component
MEVFIMGELNGFDTLARKRRLVRSGGGKEKTENAQSQPTQTARDRIAKLLDAQSIVETDAFVQNTGAAQSAPGEGVVTGYGTIDGRGVFVIAQDYAVLGGAMSAMHAGKMCKTLDFSGKTGLPVLLLLDSMGVRLGEGVAALNGFGSVFDRLAKLSGAVPIITVICGQCAGTAAFFAPLSDFVIMAEGEGGIFTAAPGAFNKTGEEPLAGKIGGASALARQGIAHFVCASLDEAFYCARRLLSYLPDNNLVDAPGEDCTDDLNRMIENYSGEFDIRRMVRSAMDDGIFLEAKSAYSPGMITGFARVNGRSVGVVATSGIELDADACVKAAGFVRFCDTFGLPIITFVDTPGFALIELQGSIIRAGAGLIGAYSETTAPMVTVITGKAIGGGYVAMASRALGADMVYAWPQAQIACLSGKAVDIIMEREVAEKAASPFEAAEAGFVDEVIYPAETRQRITGALELIIGKREIRLPKKHSSGLR